MAVPQVMECVPNVSRMHCGENNPHQPRVQRQWCQAHRQVGTCSFTVSYDSYCRKQKNATEMYLNGQVTVRSSSSDSQDTRV